MASMNEEIRTRVRQQIKARGLSQGDVAKALNMERPNITRMLAGRSGQVPENWERLLSFLDLRMTVQPAQAPAGAGEEAP